MVNRLNRVFFKLSSTSHFSVRACNCTLYSNSAHSPIFSQNFNWIRIEVNNIASTCRIAFKINVSTIFHIFAQIAYSKKLFYHLTSQFVFSSNINRFVIQVKIVFIYNYLHARKLFHLAQFLHREFSLSNASSNKQVQCFSLVFKQTIVNVVGNVRVFSKIIRVSQKLARNIHSNVSATNNSHFACIKRPSALTGRIPVVPFHKFCSTIHAAQ